MTSQLDVAVSIRSQMWRTCLPEGAALCRRAAAAALTASGIDPGATGAEVSVVLADDGLVRRLNRDFRGQDKATNVLSFPTVDGPIVDGAAARASGAAGGDLPAVLGDVVVALQTVRREAAAQGKPLGHHLSHLVVHGVLHLVGYDHDSEGDAAIMEELETRVLAELGVPDPYAPRPLGLS